MKRHDETLLWQYAARELNADDSALLEHHLGECVECRERLLDVRQARALLKDEGVFVVVKSDLRYHTKWVAQSAYPTLKVNETSAPLTITSAPATGPASARTSTRTLAVWASRVDPPRAHKTYHIT